MEVTKCLSHPLISWLSNAGNRRHRHLPKDWRRCTRKRRALMVEWEAFLGQSNG
jgi:hypothetical protein